MISAIQVQYKVNVLETLKLPDCFENRTAASQATEVLSEVMCIAKRLATFLGNANNQPAFPSAQDLEARFDDTLHRMPLVARLPLIGIKPTFKDPNDPNSGLSIVKLYMLDVYPNVDKIKLHLDHMTELWKRCNNRCDEFEQNKVSICGFLLQHVSQESRDTLELQSSFKSLYDQNNVLGRCGTSLKPRIQ